METISFDNLPQAVGLLIEKVDSLTRLLETDGNHVANDKPLSINEAAQFLKLSVPTLYGFVSKREIPFSKVGKRLYFTEGELKVWIQSGRKRTRAETASSSESILKPIKSKR